MPMITSNRRTATRNVVFRMSFRIMPVQARAAADFTQNHLLTIKSTPAEGKSGFELHLYSCAWISLARREKSQLRAIVGAGWKSGCAHDTPARLRRVIGHRLSWMITIWTDLRGATDLGTTLAFDRWVVVVPVRQLHMASFVAHRIHQDRIDPVIDMIGAILASPYLHHGRNRHSGRGIPYKGRISVP